MELNPNQYIYNTTPAPWARSHGGRGGRKIVRARKTEFAVILCLLEMSEATGMKLHQHGFLKQDQTSRQAPVGGGELVRL